MVAESVDRGVSSGRPSLHFLRVLPQSIRPEHVIVLAYAAVLSILSINKAFQFKVQSYDLAIFNQLFWNTLHGNFMFTLPECCVPMHPPNFFGSHFAPLLLVLMPFYALYQSPYTLLVIQSLALALPAFFLYRIAEKRLSRRMSWIIVAAYLLFPGTLWTGLSDFHLEAFVPLAYVMMFYFWDRDKPTQFIVSLLLLLSIYEFGPIIGLSFLVYAWLKSRRSQSRRTIGTRLLLQLALLCVVWYVGANLSIQAVWPQKGVYEPGHWSLSYLGVDAITKASYWVAQVVPLAFAPLLAPLELVPVVPWFLGSVFSNFSPYYTFPWQYSALVSGQLVIATIFTVQRFNRLRLHRALIALTLIGLVSLSPVGAYAMLYQPQFVPSLPGTDAYAGHQAISIIPSNATVLAQDDILEFLDGRTAQVFSNFPNSSAPPDFIAIHFPQRYFFLNDPPDAPMQKQVAYFLSNYKYGLVASADGYLVYELGYSGNPRVYVPYQATIPVSEFGVLPPLKQGTTSVSIPLGTHGLAWNGPWIPLGPGTYRVTFLVDVLSAGSSITLDSVYNAGNTTLAEKLVTFPAVGPSNASLDITLSGIVPQTEFRGTVGAGQSANLDFEGVEISQISAP